jgi:hypothetical protein
MAKQRNALAWEEEGFRGSEPIVMIHQKAQGRRRAPRFFTGSVLLSLIFSLRTTDAGFPRRTCHRTFLATTDLRTSSSLFHSTVNFI